MTIETLDKPRRRKFDLRTEIKNEGEAIAELLSNCRDVIGDDEYAIQDAIEGETNFKEVASEAVERIATLNGFSKSIDDQITNLIKRRDRFENQAALIKTALSAAMTTAEIDRLELPNATLSVKALPAKAIIIDEALIPSKFWKPSDPKLDRKAVLDALKSGDSVSGAALSNGGTTLQIREG